MKVNRYRDVMSLRASVNLEKNKVDEKFSIVRRNMNRSLIVSHNQSVRTNTLQSRGLCKQSTRHSTYNKPYPGYSFEWENADDYTKKNIPPVY